MPPRQLAKLPLFGPIAPWLERFDTLPSLPTLNQIARDLKLTNAAGQPIVFVPEGDAGVPYERQVFERGEIPTRPGSWHDVFNALCWFAYPRTKAALNARHIAHLQPGPRGAMRDAATQFDECGLIVLHTHPPLAQCLMAHEWHQAFWQQREALMHSMRFLVVGHAIFEKLHAPHHGLCAKAVYLHVERLGHATPIEALVQEADTRIAKALAERDAWQHPRAFSPLPILGIPGVTPDNAHEGYYFDTRQFRPPPARRPTNQSAPTPAPVQSAPEVRQAVAPRVRGEESPGPIEQDAG